MSAGKIIGLFLGLVVFSGWLFAREEERIADRREIPVEPLLVDSMLVNLGMNRISGDSAALEPLFRKLNGIRAGREEVVSMLHTGDSHVQAGFYPDVVRSRFQACFGNAGRGLVAPLKLVGTNEPVGYSILSDNSWDAVKCVEQHPEFEVGVSGVAIAAKEDRIGFTIRSTDGPFDRVVAFHHPQAPLLKASDELALDMSCPAMDTEVSTMIPLNRSTDTVTLSAEITDSLFAVPVFYSFSLENGNRGVLYHYTGVNGNTYEHINRNPQMVEQSALLKPDLIIISLGTNDSYGRNFDADYICDKIDRLIGLFRKYNPEAALLLTTPMECYSRQRINRKWTSRANPNIPGVRECIIRAAGQYGLPYWDFYAVAGGKGAMKRWNAAGLAAKDKVHLTREGYQLQGELLFRALADTYNGFIKR